MGSGVFGKNHTQKQKSANKELPRARISMKICVPVLFFEPDLFLQVPGPRSAPQIRKKPNQKISTPFSYNPRSPPSRIKDALWFKTLKTRSVLLGLLFRPAGCVGVRVGTDPASFHCLRAPRSHTFSEKVAALICVSRKGGLGRVV